MRHINKLESLQSKILKTIVNAPWYVRNEDRCKDLKISMVKEEISAGTQKDTSHRNSHRKKTKKKTPHLTQEIK